ncbi:MAG: Holliday junction branch migration protein RuvA [Bacteroidetes bacterium]|nr:Holliday junction branch migration protein RuvA [Bacteroidota bacterium]MBK9541340.1 Holliday junction branch migration protein RuvA [Bacteroidota bacterium]MBL0258780.1 Holliday junction branch migration protein RuvA [Bacteroidota bacterium]
MLNHLTGRLTEKNPASVVVECHGVGYLVNISLNTYSKISESENVRILVHLQISEDAHTLYGFADEEERRLFRLLITVSGIGCNTARMMLSSMNVDEIENALVTEDVHRLKSIKGIGEKTAQRAILELKSKLKKDGILPSLLSHLKVKDEAMAALLTLGFARNSVDKTLDSILKKNPVSTVEDLIKQALKSL